MKKFESFLFILIALGVLILFFRLGDVGLFERDEGRYGDIAREMVDTGDYLIPRMNYMEHFHKPPVPYWATALSFRIFGFTETGVRFPSASAAFGLVIIVFLMGRLLFNSETGLLSSVILLASPLFLFLGRIATPDMLFSFFVAASLYGLLHAEISDCHRRIWSVFGFVFLALAVLTKGPVAILIVFLTLAGGALLTGEWRRLKKIDWILGLLAFFALALPWFVYVCLKYPGLFHYFVFEQTADRMFSNAEHFKGWFYPVLILLAGFVPWSIFLPWSVKEELPLGEKKSETRLGSGFLLAWFVFPLLFFSLISSKQPAYVLPLFPALAVLTARPLAPFIMEGREVSGIVGKIYLWAIVAFFFGMGIAFFVYPMFFIEKTLEPTKLYFLFISPLALAAGFVALWCVLKRRVKILFVLLFIAIAVFFVTVLYAFPKVPGYFSRAELIGKLTDVLKKDDKVIAFANKTAALPFYTGRRVIEVGYSDRAHRAALQFTDKTVLEYYFRERKDIFSFLEGPSTVYVLTKKRNYQYLKDNSRVPLYIFAEGGRNKTWLILSNRPTE